IGAFLTHAFASQGARVAFVSRDARVAQALCAAVGEHCGNTPCFEACDVQNVAELQSCLKRVEERFGAVTVLINNAARDDRHDLEQLTPEEWDRLLAVNLRPHFFTAQAVAPGMRRNGGGSIINLGSNSANLGLAGYPAYVASKGAIVTLTKALARELG